MNSYEILSKKFARMAKLNHLISIVSWDEQVNMPSDSGDSRSQALAEGQAMAQEILLDPRIEDEINSAESLELGSWDRSNFLMMKKQIHDAKAIPIDLNHALTLAVMKCQQAWRELRAKNDWASFLPLQEEVVKLTREQARYRAEALGLSPYDALIDKYQEGLNSQIIDQIFEDLKAWLPDFIRKSADNQKTYVAPKGPFKIDDQKNLGLEIMKDLGFNFLRGRLDVSHHPFCGGVSSDVRMTTRYSESDFTQSLMGIIHETGHARYEQGLPHQYEFQPVGQACGMMIHESQSLLYEMQVGRSPAFLKFLAPKIQKYFGVDLSLDFDNLTRLYCHVEPSLIRVDADEVTYPAHVILRYEIEKGLIEGSLSVRDIPEVWDEKMMKYLGQNTKGNFKDGCMQDVHWPSGAFGYFPCYTLGAMLAAQLFRTIKSQSINLETEIAAGHLNSIGVWLSENIWSQGSSRHPMDLIERATGQTLNPQFFKQHLQERYFS